MADNKNIEPNVQRVSDSTSNQMLRTADKVIPINAVAIGAETTIWTPAAGKKFRLMGFYFANDAAVSMIIRDGTAGTIILRLPALAVSTLHATPQNFGNGILSATIVNPLTITGSAAGNLTGFVYGTEE